MKNKNLPKTLVLGADGMLGRIVFWYLNSKYSSVLGTSRRKDSHFLYFNAHSAQRDLTDIIQKKGNIEYIINCIGILKNEEDAQEMFEINAIFPHVLELLSEKYHFKFIHISTDAVFSPQSEKVFEDSTVKPDGMYGESKYKGETSSKNALTIRTSILGFHSTVHKSLLDWVLNTSQKTINGYINQKWSGCTTLQFAQFCEMLISQNKFEILRNK